MENLHIYNETIVTLHANYIKGNANKAKKMSEYGFWLLMRDDNNTVKSQGKSQIYNRSCQPYIPSSIRLNSVETTYKTENLADKIK